MKTLMRLMLLAGLAWLAGCRASADLDRPPDIAYGNDVCDQCRMIISEPRFAAAYVTTGGDVLRFDDVGGMLAHYHENGHDVARFWVHDYLTEEWLDARQAAFVYSDELITPMGFGIVACMTNAEAEELAGERGGKVYDFEGLLAQTTGGSMSMEKRHDH